MKYVSHIYFSFFSPQCICYIKEQNVRKKMVISTLINIKPISQFCQYMNKNLTVNKSTPQNNYELKIHNLKTDIKFKKKLLSNNEIFQKYSQTIERIPKEKKSYNKWNTLICNDIFKGFIRTKIYYFPFHHCLWDKNTMNKRFNKTFTLSYT